MQWKDINIKQFKNINKILKDKDLTDIEKNLELIAYVFDLSEDDLYDMDLGTIRKYTNELEFINEFKPDYAKEPKIKRIGDYEVGVDYHLSKFTVAQYVDFMAEINSGEPDIARLCATILIPRGHKYNDGYNLEDFIEQIDNELSIYDAESLVFFYLIKSLRLINKSHKALMMKAMANKMVKAFRF